MSHSTIHRKAATNFPSMSNFKDQITSQLQKCHSLNHLKSMYAAMIKSINHQDSYLMNQFITKCSRLHHINFAFASFNQMVNPNIFVYNAIIGGFVQSDKPSTALQLFVEMLQSTRLCPTSYTFSYLIKACEQISNLNLGNTIHGFIAKVGFGNEVIIQTGLIDFYSKLFKVAETKIVINETGERDIFAWNTMISALIHLDCFEEARKLFNEMPEKNIVSWNTMISGSSKVPDVDSAEYMFCKMPEKNLFSWTSMISCYSQNNLYGKAIETFEKMKMEGIMPDEVTVASVISACAHLGALEIGTIMHYYVMLNGFGLDVYIGSALVDMYAKCGNLERSLTVFLKLEEKNIYCWNSIIDGLAIHGRGRDAINMFYKMKKEAKIDPNWISFVSVLNACAHSGLVDESSIIFSSMIKDYLIKPRVEHYCCVVDLLSRANCIDKALEIIKCMDIEPNDVIWGALLNGCKINGNLEVGKLCIEKLLALDPGRSSSYMLMVGMYVERKKWHEISKVRSAMKNKGVEKKIRGCSWIEIDRIVHEFAATDVSHHSSDKIFILLEELSEQLKFEGRVHYLELTNIAD